VTTSVYDAFWLPAALRQQLLADVAWETVWLKGGALSETEIPDGVAVRWPRLEPSQWRALLAGLQAARSGDGREMLARWQAILEAVMGPLMEDALAMIPTLATCTGYSHEMLTTALWQGDLVNANLLSAALDFSPTWSVATRWERMPAVPGWARFFPARRSDRLLAGARRTAPLFHMAPPVDLALGYAAGNVPGTALLISLLGGLANHSAGEGVPSPAVLVRNSRHEPLFAPWILSAVEQIDPTLVAGLAVLVWDYEDEALQGELLRAAGLLIAAAGDDTIAALDAARARHAPALRFHRHGHKASFSVIERPTPAIARLAALDSSLWDQNGCLSARIHFVVGDADAYAGDLAQQMRAIATTLPRGTTPRRLVHRAYDTYQALEADGHVRVHSVYEDDFAVVLDRRPWDAGRLSRAVNACQARVVVVRPVQETSEVAGYLRQLPASNLQSVSAALEADHVLRLAGGLGAAGVTAIRSLGRAAFPQLAYSWDGLLPLDAGNVRPAGHFTTVEFDDLEEELAATTARWDL
jgi:hypothetical protein